jgi:hypothetical protein
MSAWLQMQQCARVMAGALRLITDGSGELLRLSV